jgi:prepilin-type N-terminal cleavage/methylation domain-containing protein
MHTRSGTSGFTLIEVQVAMTILVIITGTSLAFMQSTLPALRADGQARRVVALFHYARETAIARRRDVEVRFDEDAHTITLIRRDAGVEIPMETFVFEYGVQFTQFDGLGDTPESFGGTEPVDFGDSTVLLFDAEGSLIDETGLPANGTIFVGLPHVPQSARAISVTGTTGKARLYRWRTAGQAGAGWDH